MSKDTKQELIDRIKNAGVPLTDKQKENFIDQAHTAGRKEALEGVVEIVEGMPPTYHGETGNEFGEGYDEGYDDALTDIKNHLTE